MVQKEIVTGRGIRYGKNGVKRLKGKIKERNVWRKLVEEGKAHEGLYNQQRRKRRP